MPEDMMVPAGPYKLTKQFRREQMRRHKKDMPWSKRVLDMDEKRLFGRTAWAWVRIILFYLFLYALITLVVMFWYAIFMLAIIGKDSPRWLKGPPGVSFVPHNTSTITFLPKKVHDIYPIADKIESYLRSLDESAIEYFDECNEDELWGYQKQKPCVFVRLNKVIGYEPETYDTPDELPKEAPSELEDVIRKHGGTPRIWLSCEVTKGPKPSISYYPGPFYELSDGMKGVTRVVAVQLNNMPANQDVFIVCKVWARNIPIDLQFQGKGHVKFSMHMRTPSGQKPSEDSKGTTQPQENSRTPVPPPTKKGASIKETTRNFLIPPEEDDSVLEMPHKPPSDAGLPLPQQSPTKKRGPKKEPSNSDLTLPQESPPRKGGSKKGNSKKVSKKKPNDQMDDDPALSLPARPPSDAGLPLPQESPKKKKGPKKDPYHSDLTLPQESPPKKGGSKKKPKKNPNDQMDDDEALSFPPRPQSDAGLPLPQQSPPKKGGSKRVPEKKPSDQMDDDEALSFPARPPSDAGLPLPQQSPNKNKGPINEPTNDDDNDDDALDMPARPPSDSGLPSI